jgi:hypothetical protein
MGRAKALRNFRQFRPTCQELEPRRLLASVADLPLLDQSDLEYLGAFRVPTGQQGDSSFAYGGTAIGFNPANNSLFAVGHDHHQAIAEISIPEIINSEVIDDLARATVLQPFAGVLGRIPDYTLESTVKVGGLMVVDGQLLGTAYEYYDGDGDAIDSHFRFTSLDVSAGDVEGLFQVGSLGGGFVGGYMTPVPPEWQEVLGAEYITGQAALSSSAAPPPARRRSASIPTT